jgi:hypothetical protein
LCGTLAIARAPHPRRWATNNDYKKEIGAIETAFFDIDN